MLVVAGEASADSHGARLVRAVHELAPEVSFRGIGGPLMAEAGVDVLVPASDTAVVGLTEVFSKLGRIRNASRMLKRILHRDPPDLLLLLDYPEFNLNLAGTARRCGVPVLYYIGPQVWAWRRNRLRKIAARVDHMAVILPFEEPFYREAGVPVTYVGHPLLEEIPGFIRPDQSLRELGVEPGRTVLGLLPGSRDQEVANLLPPMLRAAEILKGLYPDLVCVVPAASTVSPGLIEGPAAGSSAEVILWRGGVHRMLPACRAVLVASGTATLEAALHCVPTVVAYRVSQVSYYAGRALIRIPYISLVNLVAGEAVVPELIQHRVTPGNLAREAARIMEDGRSREKMVNGLKSVGERLGSAGASGRTAAIALEMIKRRKR
ncbi:MAG: lipid-A-disaccharide synthase [Desulfobacteraceae bacterium]